MPESLADSDTHRVCCCYRGDIVGAAIFWLLVAMTVDFGKELFAFGARNRLVLFDSGCLITTKAQRVFARWDEISHVFTYGHKTSLGGFPYKQKLGLNFEMKDGKTIQIEFAPIALLWGVEFFYHNHRINKLFEILGQYVPLR